MFQRVPGQIHAVNVPGTQWSEENGNDGGLFHIEEADAPSTDCGEKATKRNDESRSLLAARADARAHHGPCATDLRANISSSSKRRRLSNLPVPKEVETNIDRSSKRNTGKAVRLFSRAAFTGQSCFGAAKDAQQKIAIADCITRKSPNFTGEDGKDGGSRKTLQRVPGQTCPVNVPGTPWSEDYRSDDGLVQIEGENAPSTSCAEGAAKTSKESITTSRAKSGKEVEEPRNKSKEYQAKLRPQKLLGILVYKIKEAKVY